MLTSFAGKKVLFFGAHTDDEMICAGTLHRIIREGGSVSVYSFATAATEYDRIGGVTSWRIVRDEWWRSMEIIGVRNKWFGGETVNPSSDFQPHRQWICQQAFDLVTSLKPDIVFTLSPDDENTAHSIVGVETERVLRGRVPTVIRCLFPWNYTLGRPNLYVRLEEEDVEAKRKVINAYQSQLFRYNYAEMLMSYCRADGLSIKVPYAERFELVRSVL